MAELIESEREYAVLADVGEEDLRRMKRFGFSDRQLGALRGETEAAVRQRRWMLRVRPSYKMVDTCAGEFPSETPYLYGSYDEESEAPRTDRRSVVILGSGPNRIGQGVEFDYCCVRAVIALRDRGFETIMISPTRCPCSPIARAAAGAWTAASRSGRRGPTRPRTGGSGCARRGASRSRRPACPRPTGPAPSRTGATTRGPPAGCGRCAPRPRHRGHRVGRAQPAARRIAPALRIVGRAAHPARALFGLYGWPDLQVVITGSANDGAHGLHHELARRPHADPRVRARVVVRRASATTRRRRRGSTRASPPGPRRRRAAGRPAARRTRSSRVAPPVASTSSAPCRFDYVDVYFGGACLLARIRPASVARASAAPCGVRVAPIRMEHRGRLPRRDGRRGGLDVARRSLARVPRPLTRFSAVSGGRKRVSAA